jgi:hypothetical protein
VEGVTGSTGGRGRGVGSHACCQEQIKLKTREIDGEGEKRIVDGGGGSDHHEGRGGGNTHRYITDAAHTYAETHRYSSTKTPLHTPHTGYSEVVRDRQAPALPEDRQAVQREVVQPPRPHIEEESLDYGGGRRYCLLNPISVRYMCLNPINTMKPQHWWTHRTNWATRGLELRTSWTEEGT